MLVALSVVACGETRSDRDAGRRVFNAQSCGSCHTFKGAGSTGRRGPDLDALRPSKGRVLRQVRLGGGGMPAYAGELTPQEMNDLATFVAGEQRPSTAGATGPFHPSDLELRDCRGSDLACLEQAFGNATYADGPAAALARLETAMRDDADVAAGCHRIAHRMGAAALLRFKGRVAAAFVAGSPTCASGFYHGIVERAFAGAGPRDLPVAARRLCQDAGIVRTTFLRFQCLHGLGHGLMIHTGYDLPGSLRACDGVGDVFVRDSCTGGVFMENFGTSYAVRSRYVRDSDPMYPCNVVAERHKRSCYGLVTINLLRIERRDLRKVAEGCERSGEQRWIRVCFESFGRDVSAIVRHVAPRARAVCRLARDGEADCLRGVAQEITNSDAGGRRAGAFCAIVRIRARGRCFEGVGAVLAAVTPDPVKLRAACRAAARTARWAGRCAAGAGAPK